jgi:hypothetical protein
MQDGRLVGKVRPNSKFSDFMATRQQVLAIFRPSAWVLLAFAAWLGVRWLWPSFRDDAEAAQVPLLLADQIQMPHPKFTPAEVVDIQLRGLAAPGKDAVGIWQCFCFASPRNRAATGPLDRFGQMVRAEPFACLGNAPAVLMGKPQIDDRFAKLLVTVVDQGQQLRAFTFILFKQQGGPFADCWMTEAVYPQGGLGPNVPDAPEVRSDAA